MGKNKLQRFAEYDAFPHCFDHNCELKGKWSSEYFKNDKPIVLELACGKGDYAIGLAKMHPEKNYIGIDIKGARLWKGAKRVEEESIENVAFLRIQIDHILEHFDKNEISEIWITFPDPQPNKERKRLTGPMFLERYKEILTPDATINLKCDSELMYEFTLETIENEGLVLHTHNDDIYAWDECPKEMEIKTFYEKIWLKEGRKIKYIKFSLPTAP
jgi:tRNA (guanine-N7-)-methyltransferase